MLVIHPPVFHSSESNHGVVYDPLDELQSSFLEDFEKHIWTELSQRIFEGVRDTLKTSSETDLSFLQTFLSETVRTCTSETVRSYRARSLPVSTLQPTLIEHHTPPVLTYNQNALECGNTHHSDEQSTMSLVTESTKRASCSKPDTIASADDVPNIEATSDASLGDVNVESSRIRDGSLPRDPSNYCSTDADSTLNASISRADSKLG
jgi:hypothetical protein